MTDDYTFDIIGIQSVEVRQVKLEKKQSWVWDDVMNGGVCG